MPLAVDSAGKITANPTTGKINNNSRKGVASLREDLGLNDLIQPTRKQTTGAEKLREDLGTSVTNALKADDVQPAQPVETPQIRPTSVPVTASRAARQVSPSGMFGMRGSSLAMPSDFFSSALAGSLRDVKPETVEPIDLLPSYGSDDETNSAYESYFSQSGMSDDDIDAIRGRGSWMDVHTANPAEDLAVNSLGQNPFLGTTFDDLREGIGKEINSLAQEGKLTEPQSPVRYTNADAIGGINYIDNGRTMDYDHLTADRATGDAMQRYAEMGMGGRDWWEYDPYSIYLKSDEAADFGFKPYLPDKTAKANMLTSNVLDSFSDAAGILGQSRELLTDYGIDYDTGNGNTLKLSGSDWDYRAPAYVNNMRKMIAQDPGTFLSMPENGEIHGAPVSVMVLEHEMKDADGNTRYLYGDLVDSGSDLDITYADGSVVAIPSSEYGSWDLDESGALMLPEQYQGDIVDTSFDDNLHLVFADGQDIYVPESEYSQWPTRDGSTFMPDAPYVPIEQARGFLPEDYDRLNDGARSRGIIEDAPILYLPDMVMDDGTRLSWNQVQDIYYDHDAEDNPDTSTDDAISYDFGPLNIAKPRRLSGGILNEDAKGLTDIPGSINWADMLNNAYDFTMSSIPISVSQVAWPMSISQGISKSMSGIDPGQYDQITGSDRYLSSEIDENGDLVPSYSQINQLANVAGNSLVPLTEEIAGPIGGSSLLDMLSGELPRYPTRGQVAKAFLTGAIGEGLEEMVGNVFDELTGQGVAAYGDVVTPQGERLLDDNGEPVRDENGNYRFTDANGVPYTYMTDETGHIYQDPNTPIDRRLSRINPFNPQNFNDYANAFAGGVLVDLAMQALKGQPFMDFYDASVRDRLRRNTGVSQYVDTERDEMRDEALANREMFDVTQGDVVDIDPRYMRLFDNQVRAEKE